MPTEYKFDDLDLREQPARAGGPGSDIVTRQTCTSVKCQTDYCSDVCCFTDITCPEYTC